MGTTLSRKAWRDLGRRRARAVLTAATIALAVAGIGLLAVPSLIDRTMRAEVDESRLYDIRLSVRDMELDDATAAELAALPNVRTVSTRASYAARVLVDDRRIPAIVWGVGDFDAQPIDVVDVTGGVPPGDLQVLADDGNGRAVDVDLDTGDRVRLMQPDGSITELEVSGSARSLAFWQGPWDHPKQLYLYASNSTVRAVSGASGVNVIELLLDDTSAAAVDATVVRVRQWLDDTVGPGAMTDLPLTRDEGDWPGRVFANQMTHFVYVLAGLALVTATFLIANTMNTLMAEQTSEIGIMRAIGGRRRQVAGVFVRSALHLAVFGVLLGVPLGVLLASVISGFVTSGVLGVPGRFGVSVPVVVVSALFAVVLTVGATLPALRRALRIPVREALQSHGAAETFGTSRLDRLVLRGRALPRTLRLGARNLARNKRRSVATTLQIALAVATALGFLNMAVSFGRALDHDYAMIPWDASVYAPSGAPRFDASAIDLVASTPGVDRVEPVLVNSLELGSSPVVVYGMTATPLYEPDLDTGRWFAADEVERATPLAVIGPNAAREEGLEPGDLVTVRTAGGEAQLLVVGVDSGQRDNGRAFYVPLSWLQHETGWSGTTNLLWFSVQAEDHGTIDRVANDVEDALAAAGYRAVPEKLYELKAENEAANDAILGMIVLVGGVVVAIGMVGLVNSITMNVIERTREIGVLRCVGARAADIRRVFAAESVAQATLGWVLGMPLGLLLSWLLTKLTLVIMELRIATVFDVPIALTVLAATAVLAALVVLGPVRRATRINPGDALRYL